MADSSAGTGTKIVVGVIAVIVLGLLTYFNTDYLQFGDNGADEAATATDTETQATPERESMNKTCDTVDIGSLSDPENTLLMEVSSGGCVVIEMMPDKAPNHVARFKELTREGFYDGIVFHRVIEGFMAQTGDPTGTGAGGSGQNINAEFNDVAHERGIVSTARAMDPNSADSQFFIMFGTSPHLDGQYTVWGRVTSGMEYIDAIQRGEGQGGMVPEDARDKIVKMVVASDMK